MDDNIRDDKMSDNRKGGNHPHTREFSMFFQAVLSILGVVALMMMNSIISKMDTIAISQQDTALTL